jgi:hypothetical protein
MSKYRQHVYVRVGEDRFPLSRNPLYTECYTSTSVEGVTVKLRHAKSFSFKSQSSVNTLLCFRQALTFIFSPYTGCHD